MFNNLNKMKNPFFYFLTLLLFTYCNPVRENNSLPFFKNLVWGDEFNYEGEINRSLWHLQTIPIDNGSWANNELQHYTENIKNCFVKDGYLNRDDALKLAEEDNEIRMETIDNFCRIVNLDTEEILLKIQNLKKRY